jgi:CrcB protein
MKSLLLIALFGAGGCLARYGISGLVYRIAGHQFPYGTLVVNIIGSFLIGCIMEFSLRSALIPPSIRLALTIGFLGGLTTFSTFSYETMRLLEEGRIIIAMGNVLISVFLCLLGTWMGIVAARLT